MKIFFKYILTLFFLLVFLFFIITPSSPNNYKGILVHFIDIGQGDAILIQVNNKNLLIDSGSKTERRNLFSYLNNLNIHFLDYIIATHPHEDHIGNMSEIIDTYDFGTFYTPNISASSKSFEKMLYSLKKKDKKINAISSTTNNIYLGDNTSVTVFSPPPSSKYNDLNDYSPIIRISYKEISFLLTGDAETNAENLSLANNSNIKSTVLKIGHHGSSSSTSSKFLQAVSPNIAIISCGKDNPYGHPHKETIDKLKNKDIKTFSTSSYGDIILSSDGYKLKISTNNN
ncbi:MAG: ComEC/Rec2 family competence protein [Clostridium sp.]